MVRNGAEMTRALRDLKNDPELRETLVRHGLETIRKAPHLRSPSAMS